MTVTEKIIPSRVLLLTLAIVLMGLSAAAQEIVKTVSFNPNQQELDASAEHSLDYFMVTTPNHKWTRIIPEGGTENMNAAEATFASLQRAEAIKQHMSNRGILPDNLMLCKVRSRDSNGITSNSWVLKARINPIRIPGLPVGTTFMRDELGALGRYLKAPHRSTVNPKQDFTVNCPQGTRLHFDANSFVNSIGEQPEGMVEIIVHEFYSKKDLMLAGLHTMAGNRMLESGGTIHVQVMGANGSQQRYQLAAGMNYEIEFPIRGDEKPGMQWFDGTTDSENGVAIDWTQPGFNEEWGWETEQMFLDAETDEATISEIGESFNIIDGEYLKEMETTSKADGYLLSGSDLGWINCDRFYEDANKTDMMVKLNSDLTGLSLAGNVSIRPRVRIIFKDINSIMDGWGSGQEYSFNNIPAGRAVTVIAYATVNDQPVMAVQTATVGSGTPELTMVPTTWKKLEQTFSTL